MQPHRESINGPEIRCKFRRFQEERGGLQLQLEEQRRQSRRRQELVGQGQEVSVRQSALQGAEVVKVVSSTRARTRASATATCRPLQCSPVRRTGCALRSSRRGGGGRGDLEFSGEFESRRNCASKEKEAKQLFYVEGCRTANSDFCFGWKADLMHRSRSEAADQHPGNRRNRRQALRSHRARTQHCLHCRG
jgi:hypothetical protein